jgi:hypothetical protein
MLPDTRDWHGMGYGSHPYGMGYSPYTMGYGYHPYEMSGYHYPYHDGVMQSQSVLINVPHMMHGMKHRLL